jgi:hypothetical protein
MKEMEKLPEKQSFARTYSVVKKLTVETTAKRFRSAAI